MAGGSELLRLTTRETPRLKGNSDSPYRTMDFSHDGRWLVVADDGYVHLWDLTTRREAATLPIALSWIGFQQPVKIAFTQDDSGVLSCQ